MVSLHLVSLAWHLLLGVSLLWCLELCFLSLVKQSLDEATQELGKSVDAYSRKASGLIQDLSRKVGELTRVLAELRDFVRSTHTATACKSDKTGGVPPTSAPTPPTSPPSPTRSCVVAHKRDHRTPSHSNMGTCPAVLPHVC